MLIDSPFYWLISSALVGFAACLAMALLQYPFVRWICRTKPTRFSSDFWFAWGIFPILLGIFVTGFALVFDWVSATGWLSNPHAQPSPRGGEFFWGVALASFTVVAAAAVCSYRRYLPTHRLPSVLPEKTGGDQPVSFTLLPSKLPAAFSAGLFSPRVYLTQAAVELLSEQEQGIVLSHEREHIRKKDPLRLLFLTFCEYWLPGMRYLRRQWQRRVEMECDLVCMKLGFAADQVASTILKFERAKTSWRSPALALAYAPENSSDLKLRIESLFDDQPRAIGQAPILSGWVALCLVLGSNFMEVHRGVKIFLGWFH